MIWGGVTVVMALDPFFQLQCMEEGRGLWSLVWELSTLGGLDR